MSNAGKGTIISAVVVLLGGLGVGLMVGGKGDSGTVTQTVAATVTAAPTAPTTATTSTTSTDGTPVSGPGQLMSDLVENGELKCGGDGDISEPNWGEQQTVGREQFNKPIWYEVYLNEAGTQAGSCGVPGSAKVFVSKVGLSSAQGESSGYKANLELRSNSEQGKVLWRSELTADAEAKNVSADLSGTTRLFFVLSWSVRDLPDVYPSPLLVFGDPKFK